MPKKKTTTEFVNELKVIAPGILSLEPYIDSKTKIKCKCLECGNEWSAAPAHLLSGKGCPVCSRKNSADKRKYSKAEFSEKLHLIHPEIEVIGDYINSQTKIEVHCSKCGNTWSVVPASLLSGTGCPKCNKRYRRNTEQFTKELYTVSPHITVLGRYKNAREKIRVKCNRCGTEWLAAPYALLKGNDCPFCGHSQTSVIEQIIYKAFCVIVGSENVTNRDKQTVGKELDVYIKNLALAIEFGAWYWHSNKIQNDYEKERLCESLGIHLITVYEGCPDDAIHGNLKNAICYPSLLSNEKEYTSVQELIVSICREYQLDASEIISNWKDIVKQAKEESRKKDAEQFAYELSIVNPDIEYLGEYTGSKNRVHARCRVCGTKWVASSAYDLLHGHGCPECAKEKRNKAQRLSPKEFRERASEINPDIELLEEFRSMKETVLCRCKICGTKWRARPDSLIRKKRNCPRCSPVTKKTNEQFLEELSAINDSIVPLEEYKSNRAPIRVRCKICGYEWSVKPSDLLHGTGCPKCANRVSISHDEFVERINRINNTIEIIGEYKDSKTRVKCRCKNCGYEWLGLPSNLLSGSGCQRCAGTLRPSNDEFKKKLASINSTITPLEPYVNRKTKIMCRCEVCGNEWMAIPGNLLSGHGCPKCKAEKTRRNRERRIICLETGQTYSSVSAARIATGITTISDCLNGRTKMAGGFHWAYMK